MTDNPPTLTLILTPASISENGGVSTVTATLSHASSAAISGHGVGRAHGVGHGGRLYAERGRR